MILTAKLPFQPVGKARPRFYQGNVYTPSKTAKFERLVRKEIDRQTGGIMFDENDAVMITATFVHAMPKSWSKAKRSIMNGKPWTGKPDIDNLEKALFDGIVGAVLQDDKQIAATISRKVYGDTGCIELVIESIR